MIFKNVRKSWTVLKHGRDGMSLLASNKNVQWSAEGATNFVYHRVQNHMNLSSLRSASFDERNIRWNFIDEEIKEKKWKKNWVKFKKRVFERTRSRQTFDGKLDGKKLDHILVVLSEGAWFLYLLAVLRKLNYWYEKISDFFSSLHLPKKTEGKGLEFRIWCLGHDI